jgi:YbbR domain-containing protein
MKNLLLHNWHLKLISLALAAVLWAAVANSPISEIGVSVSLEYQNIPPEMEVFGDTTDLVQVRLRGPSSVLRTVTPQDVSLAIDMTGVTAGQERILPLTPETVKAPFGAEVIRVVPAQVRLTLERTARKSIRIAPAWSGVPADGFEIGRVVAVPAMVDIEGPESHIREISEISTTAINVDGRTATFSESAELDILDPVIRMSRREPVNVEIEIRPQSQ